MYSCQVIPLSVVNWQGTVLVSPSKVVSVSIFSIYRVGRPSVNWILTETE